MIRASPATRSPRAAQGEDAGGAIYFGGSQLTANFDRFVNNSTAKSGAGNEIDFNAGNSGTVNIEDDWWGSNTGPAAEDNVLTGPTGSIAPTHYLVLTNTRQPQHDQRRRRLEPDGRLYTRQHWHGRIGDGPRRRPYLPGLHRPDGRLRRPGGRNPVQRANDDPIRWDGDGHLHCHNGRLRQFHRHGGRRHRHGRH